MIKFFSAILILCSAVWAAPRIEIDPHIVGGTPAPEGSYPFIVSLRDFNVPDYVFCGGAFISPKHVLTAAHCVVGLDKLKIGYGSIHLGQQIFEDVINVKVHPDYSSFDNHNDIALLTLKSKLDLKEDSIISFNCNENLDGKSVTALGWGRTSANGPISTRLLYLNKPITSNKDCSKNLATPLHNGQICLGSTTDHGMCFGDSGSPLLYKGQDGKNYTVGIVSWGIPCAKGYPDVFTRVPYYQDFITQNMN